MPNANRFGEPAGGDVPLWVTRYTPDQTGLVRTKLQMERRARDLALFNQAIDGKLRGRDVVLIRVEDVAAAGYTADRTTVPPTKNWAACQIRTD